MYIFSVLSCKASTFWTAGYSDSSKPPQASGGHPGFKNMLIFTFLKSQIANLSLRFYEHLSVLNAVRKVVLLSLMMITLGKPERYGISYFHTFCMQSRNTGTNTKH